MKKLVLLLGIVLLISSSVEAQDSQSIRKAAKEAKTAAKVAEANAKFVKAVAAIDAKNFVIIVDYYKANGTGQVLSNTDKTNFFSYEKENAFVQGVIFFGETYPSSHKLDVSNYTQVVDKKGNIKIQMIVQGTMTRGRVEIFLKKGDNFADVIYTMRGFKVRYSGEIIPTAESDYFKRVVQV
jgi:Ni,Fe-hydrogenase maturation factor